MPKAARASADRIAILTLAAAFIAQQLTHWQWLSPTLGVLVFAAIAWLLPGLRGMTLWLTVAFMAAGAALMLFQQADADAWFAAASLNVTIATLFVFAPLFGIPVRLPDYAEALRRFYETKLRSRTVTYAGTQLMTQIMGAFINVGSISVVYHLAFVKPRTEKLSRLLANALNRGFAGAIAWSPYFAAMALVTSALSLRWSELIPYLLGLAALCFVVGLAVDYRKLREPEEEPAGEEGSSIPADADAKPAGKAPFPAGLAMYLASAIAAIVLLEHAVDLPMVLVTCLAAAAFPLAWCAAKGRLATYRQGLASHYSTTLPALKKEITLFLAAGFFSGSIGTTGFGASLPVWLDALPLPVPLSFSLLAVLLVAGTSLAGLHPIVPVTILATGIAPAAVHLSPQEFGLLLLGSWAVSNPISPASAVNNLLAGLFGKPVFVFARANYAFSAWLGVALLGYLALVRLIG
ncbi:hypothetical protein [Cohnella sp. GCM10027633]|uniref:hypothetical protein n=1 Tax=unclassified Cohnella TaxID=2636738 RepID=UPI0036433EA2